MSVSLEGIRHGAEGRAKAMEMHAYDTSVDSLIYLVGK